MQPTQVSELRTQNSTHRTRFTLHSLLFTLLIVWGWEILLGQVPVWGASYLQFQPWWSAVGAAYREGQLPLWNPHAGFGAPLLANPQAAALSPFALLTVVLPAERALAISLLGHALIAALGSWLAARRLGADPIGATLAGIGFPLSGAVASWAVFPPYFATASWLPLAFAVGVSNRGAPFVPAIVLALAWFDGHPQAWLMVAIGAVAGGLAGARWPDRWSDRWRQLPGTFIRVAGPLLLIVGSLIAIQLMPALDLLSQSTRAAGIGSLLAASLDPPPIGLLLVLIPDLFGYPANGDYAGPAGIWNLAWFAGSATLPLAVAGVRHLRARPLVILLLLGLVLAFVPALPGVGAIGRLIAGGELLRGSGRFLLLADFSLALLAGLGIAWLRASDAETGRRFGRRVAAVGTGIATGGLVGLAYGGGPFVRVGVLIAATGALIVGARSAVPGSLGNQPIAGARWTVPILAIVLGTAVELLIWARPLLPLGDARWYEGASGGQTRFVTEAVFLDRFFQAFSLNAYDRSAADPRGAQILPNRATAAGAREREGARARGGESATTPRQGALTPTLSLAREREPGASRSPSPFAFHLAPWDALTERSTFTLQPSTAIQPSAFRLPPSDARPAAFPRDIPSYDPLRPRLEDWIVSAAARAGTAVAIGRLGVQEIVEADHTVSVSTTRPRFQLVHRAVVIPDPGAALERLFDPAFDANEVVILAASWPTSPAGDGPVAGTIRLHTIGAERLVIETISPAPGFLRVLDLDYPGWQASVDGEPVPILNADIAFRAIPVPAGMHTIVLEYRPPSVLVGGIISGIGWSVALILLGRRFLNRSGRSG